MKRCKYCKEQFEAIHWNQKYCLKEECKQYWFAEAWKTRRKQIKQDLETLPEALAKTQKIFNQYIRLRDEGQRCISCDKVPKKKNAGHYFSSGGHSNIRFDEFNVHLQCEYCNTSLSGNLIPYRKNLKKKIGDDQFVYLEQRAYLIKKWSKDELLIIQEEYKEKIKSLKNLHIEK